MTIPPIKLRGVRQAVPPGYVVGRVDPNIGDVQLIPFNDLAVNLAKTSTFRGSTQIPFDTLGFQAPGPFSTGQQFSLAPCIADTTFPSGKPSTFTCAVTPHGATLSYLIYDLPSFLSLGAPHGVLAEVSFAASSPTGTVVWFNTPLTIVVGQILTMVMPSPADPAFSGVLFQFVGNPA